MARLKTTVQQVRTSCANDVRKRDVQIQRLKGHLTAQQRGNKSGLVGASITITPGSGSSSAAADATQSDSGSLNLDDPGYRLRQETTEFLTSLSQELSDENDTLIGLVRSTLGTLRELQGLPQTLQRATSDLAESSGHDEGEGRSDTEMLHALPTSYDALAADMDTVLETLRTLLTNPSFVPIDEVAIREQEIQRLRDGWEKMETKWREAITMMDGWRKRMVDGGDTVNLEELKLGLGLGIGLKTQESADNSMDLGDIEEGAEMEKDDRDQQDTEFPSPSKSDCHDDAVPIKQSSSARGPSFQDIDLHKPYLPLKDSHRYIRSPTKVKFLTPSLEVHHPGPEDYFDEIGISSISARSHDKADTSDKSRKRSSSPTKLAEERSPKVSLTVQEKLNVAQAEAEAAAAARKRLKESEDDTEPKNVEMVDRNDASERSERSADSGYGDEVADLQSHGEVRERNSPKKSNVKGRPRKRKSTLTAAELDTLMGDFLN